MKTQLQPTKQDLFKPFLAFFGFFGILLFCMAGESIVTAILPFILANLAYLFFGGLIVFILLLLPIKQ